MKIADPPRWRPGDAFDAQYRGRDHRHEFFRRLRAAGLREGAIVTSTMAERVWPKAQWLQDTAPPDTT